MCSKRSNWNTPSAVHYNWAKCRARCHGIIWIRYLTKYELRDSWILGGKQKLLEFICALYGLLRFKFFFFCNHFPATFSTQTSLNASLVYWIYCQCVYAFMCYSNYRLNVGGTKWKRPGLWEFFQLKYITRALSLNKYRI